MFEFHEPLNKLISYIERQGYKGYDPYDTLNSFIPLQWFGKYIQSLAIQFQKRNPVNIRPLLGIKKEYNPKGMGLMLQGFSLLYQKTQNPEYKRKMDFLFDWLKTNYSKGYSGYCWGYYFTWTNPQKSLKAFQPTIVVTSFVCKGIFEYFKATGNDEAKELLISASNYILNDLPVTENEYGICFSYSDLIKDCCFNASMLGTEVLAKVYSLTSNKELLDKIEKSVQFTLHYQKSDGRWDYAINIDNDCVDNQTDFHQGFVLESLNEIAEYCKIKDIGKSITMGLDFYYNEQFLKNGQSKWRLPKTYPTDIHGQAQGIITFSKMQKFENNYLEFANKIAKYTIENMAKADGRFIYQKSFIWENKISYMRWSQAWMLLALATLYNHS
jgi:rhamnogalacturonyl hydrolase YesR